MEIRGEIRIIEDRCKGCGFCVEFCPWNVLELSKEFSSKGYHTPYVKNPEDCINCKLCELLCPEFAIWCTLREKGEVHITKESCKGCGFCIEYCPCEVLGRSDEFNAKGYYPPYIREPEDCINCKVCELLCPEFAIWVTLKEETSSSLQESLQTQVDNLSCKTK